MPAAQNAMEIAAPAITAARGRPRCSRTPAKRFPATFTAVTSAVTIAAVAVEKPRRSTCKVGRKPTMASQQQE